MISGTSAISRFKLVHGLAKQVHVAVGDMTPVFAQVHGNAVRPANSASTAAQTGSGPGIAPDNSRGFPVVYWAER